MRDRQQKSLSMRPSAFDIYKEIYPNLTFFVMWNQKYKFWRLKIHNRKKISLTNRPNDWSAIIQIILSHKITLCEKQIEIDIGVYFKKNFPFHWVANCKVDHWVSEFFSILHNLLELLLWYLIILFVSSEASGLLCSTEERNKNKESLFSSQICNDSGSFYAHTRPTLFYWNGEL